VLRLGLGFLVALTLSGIVTGVSLVRLWSAPGGLPVSAPAPNVTELAAPAPGPRHLPAWVQTRQSAVLWSGPDRQAVAFTRLPAWTFLKVGGVQNDRLRVEYAGDGQSRQPGPGWISLSDVQPSDQGGTWLRTHRPSSLFNAPASGAAVVASLPQWSWLIGLDDAGVGGRVHVRAYGPSLGTVLGEGWVPASDVGPTGSPAQSVSTAATSKSLSPALYASHETFITAVGAAARDARQTMGGVPASVTVAQAILESSWGESRLTRDANNYFGIKATGQIGNDGAVWMPTLEYADGGSYTVVAPFRAYRTLADSVVDHARLFQQVGLYRSALEAAGDPDEFARRIAQAGYATDPRYADKLIDLMQRYDLYRFDVPSSPPTSRSA
jgi:hypothetical protein